MGWLKVLLNANNAEGVREAIRISYIKHVRLASQGKIPTADTSPHHVGLYGALSSRYKASGIQTNEVILWGELAPFLLMRESDSIEALAEYVVFKEKPQEAKEQWLKKAINDALRVPPASDESPRTFAPIGIINQVAWCNLLDADIENILEAEAEKFIDHKESKPKDNNEINSNGDKKSQIHNVSSKEFGEYIVQFVVEAVDQTLRPSLIFDQDINKPFKPLNEDELLIFCLFPFDIIVSREIKAHVDEVRGYARDRLLVSVNNFINSKGIKALSNENWERIVESRFASYAAALSVQKGESGGDALIRFSKIACDNILGPENDDLRLMMELGSFFTSTMQEISAKIKMFNIVDT